jgi:Xaa-Pro aminopeptidase
MINSKIFQDRLELIKEKIVENNLSAFLISNPMNIRYLTGFEPFLISERESMLIVDRKASYLYLPRAYEMISPKIRGLKIKIIFEWAKIFEEISKQLKKYRGKIGFEPENLKFDEYKILKKGISFFAKKDFVNEMREIKDEKEILNIKMAFEITDRVFKRILKFIKPGIREKQISFKLKELMEELGAQGPSFEPIVAFGEKTSQPHCFAGDQKLKKNEPILIDFGVKFNGYCSDFTRMVYLGKVPKLFRDRYKIVQEAQTIAIETIRPGILAENIHKVVFKSLGKEAKNFFHATGHGVGLEPHEKPFLKKGIKEEIKENMVLTVEPGLYYKKYGIRIEDCGLVTKKGFKILSKVKNDLIEI